jgi:tRNA dimethylallyltransferase
MEKRKPKIIVIAGPTASGKTATGIELAETFGGEIVSADSIQIYRHMDVGSAKPTAEERSRVPHHMIDIRLPDQPYSAGEYMREARQCIERILETGRVPIVVGGTGLYIRTLLRGVVDSAPTDPHVRARLKNEERTGGPDTLYEKLKVLDPEAASKIPRSNLYRIIRALEVVELTGKKMSRLHREHAFEDRPYRYLFICLAPERKVLYDRIDKRVDSMINGRLLKEVCNLYQLGYSRHLKPLQSLGYRHAGMVLAGEIGLDEAVKLMKRDTRRYAKRQFTWFRSEPKVVWCDPAQGHGIRFMIANYLGR